MAKWKSKAEKDVHILVRNKIFPALFTAITFSLLIVLLDLVSFDLKFGVGSSYIIFASFGTSAFLFFMTPKSPAAHDDMLLKSYFIGAVLGSIGYFMLQYLPLFLVAGIVLLVMSMLVVKLNCAHPPGVGIAAAFILFHIGVDGIVIVLAGALMLIGFHRIIEKIRIPE